MGVLNVTPDSFSDGGLFVDPAERDRARAPAGRGGRGARRRRRRVHASGRGAGLGRGGARARRAGARRAAWAPGVDRHVQGRGRAARRSNWASSSSTTSPRCAATLTWPRSSPTETRSSVSCTCRASRARCRSPLGTTTSSRMCWPSSRNASRSQSRTGSPRSGSAWIPGIGFGKTPDQNLELLRRLDELRALGRPVLVGVSRKSTLGKVLGDAGATTGSLAASVAAAVAAFERGASMIRAHDVRETVEALAVASAVERGRINA